jgi:hypothetical protein
MKARHRRTLFFSILSVFLALILALVIVPPMFNLKGLRPGLENAILRQTGIPTKIDGRINISLLGHLHIVAYDVSIPNGKIDSVMFAVPLGKIFNLSDVNSLDEIFLDEANMYIQNLSAPHIDTKINITDSIVRFLNKDYKIIDGTLDGDNFHGIIRTNQHKYSLEKSGAIFSVINKNEGLTITGEFLPSGSARATLSIDTNNINAWFDFFEPDIYEHVQLKMNINWDGKYGFVFSNLRGKVGGDDFTGSIELPESGMRKIKFSSQKIDFDLSFLLSQKSLLTNAELELDLTGRLKFANKYYDKVKLIARGTDDAIIIENLEFENDKTSGVIKGEITGAGAKNLALNFNYGDAEIYCLFNGMPDIWRCDDYEYTDNNLSISGTLTTDTNGFAATLKSDDLMPDNFDFASATSFLGRTGTIIFEFADAKGRIEIKDKKQNIIYDFIIGKSLSQTNKNEFEFLPDDMRNETGEMFWNENDFNFSAYSGKWELTTQGNFFYLSAASAKDFLRGFYPELELPFINDFPFEMSGNYSKSSVNDLEIRIINHIFRGSANQANITLKTPLLNLDDFINRAYFDNYEETQFLSDVPVIALFRLAPTGLSFSAENIIWHGEKYDNFVYSLRDKTQDFGITDDARGSLLASLKKREGASYDIMLKLNRFAFAGGLLGRDAPLNISDSVATGRAQLMTNGKIAYDFWRNLVGDIELTFDGGNVIGIGTDALYAALPSLTIATTEDAIARAISGGITAIKSLRITGKYDNGKFQTTSPFALVARQTEITGNLQLDEMGMSAQTMILLRGLSSNPAPIPMTILPPNERSYTITETIRTMEI